MCIDKNKLKEELEKLSLEELSDLICNMSTDTDTLCNALLNSSDEIIELYSQIKNL